MKKIAQIVLAISIICFFVDSFSTAIEKEEAMLKQRVAPHVQSLSDKKAVVAH